MSCGIVAVGHPGLPDSCVLRGNLLVEICAGPRLLPVWCMARVLIGSTTRLVLAWTKFKVPLNKWTIVNY